MSPQNFPSIKQEDADLKPDLLARGTKRTASFGTDPFSDNEREAIRQKLDVGLSREETMQRPGPGGMRITYIEGWKVIHDANQIFGFNGWSSHIVNLDLRFVDEARGRYSACVSATVRITLRDGTTREDRGGGISENVRSKGEAIVKAEKEAITDATKRALKNFGLRLGLSLYDRQHLRDMNRPAPREPLREANHVNVNAQTPVATRPAPGQQGRFSPKERPSSPMTPAVPQFAKAQASSALAAANAAPTAADNAIDNALSAKITPNGQQTLLQKQQAFQRARANQSPSNAAANINAFRNQQTMQQAVSAISAGQFAAVPPSFSAAVQRAPRSGGFNTAIPPSHPNNVQQNGKVSRPLSHGLSMQNVGVPVAYPGGKQQFNANVRGGHRGAMSRKNPNAPGRPPNNGQNRRADVTVSLGISTGVPNGVANLDSIALQANVSDAVKQNEIDELSAIALADF